jgi:hypothetical protein
LHARVFLSYRFSTKAPEVVLLASQRTLEDNARINPTSSTLYFHHNKTSRNAFLNNRACPVYDTGSIHLLVDCPVNIDKSQSPLGCNWTRLP